MPYIPQQDRARLEPFLSALRSEIDRSGISNGELNYLVTRLGLLYLARHGESYNTISDVVKAFECAKLELYARVARPYEDKKCSQNGDVYP